MDSRSKEKLVLRTQVFRGQGQNLRPPLLLFGKLGSRRKQLNALGGLTYLRDSVSGLTFLVDTGAAVSVIPHSASPSTAQGPTLAGADGKGITSWGKVFKSVCFNGTTFTDVRLCWQLFQNRFWAQIFSQNIIC
jgi:hypothetical protein